MKYIIDKTVSAVTSDSIQITNNRGYTLPAKAFPAPNVPMSFCLSGTLSDGEEITIEYFDGIEWFTLKINGAVVSLNVDNNVISIYAPLIVRFIKPITVNPVGLFITTV
jgi:hypothetical protein